MMAFYELREFEGLRTPCFSFGLVECHSTCRLIFKLKIGGEENSKQISEVLPLHAFLFILTLYFANSDSFNFPKVQPFSPQVRIILES